MLRVLWFNTYLTNQATNAVVIALLSFQFQVERCNVQFAIVQRVESASAGAVRVPHSTSIWANLAQEQIKDYVPILIGGFKLGREFDALRHSTFCNIPTDRSNFSIFAFA